MSVFTSAFADTSIFFRLRTIDTFDPRAGQKCGKYSKQTKVWIECVRLRFSLSTRHDTTRHDTKQEEPLITYLIFTLDKEENCGFTFNMAAQVLYLELHGVDRVTPCCRKTTWCQIMPAPSMFFCSEQYSEFCCVKLERTKSYLTLVIALA
jgi:hypothetical protein